MAAPTEAQQEALARRRSSSARTADDAGFEAPRPLPLSGGYMSVTGHEVDATSAGRAPRPWITGVWKRFPYLGLPALLGVLLLTTFSVVIILCSDGKPVDDWYILRMKIQPQVWVAVLSTLSNTMLNFAFAEGLTIRFWRQAGQACVIVTASMVRGPFLQRSSTVGTRLYQTTNATTLRVAPYVPQRYLHDSRPDHSSQPWERLPQGKMVSPMAIKVVEDLSSNRTIPYNNTGCRGHCTTSVRALGWNVNCNTSWHTLDLVNNNWTAQAIQLGCGTNLTTLRGTKKPGCETNNTGRATIFATGFEASQHAFTIKATAKTFAGCTGAVATRTCRLLPATVEYAVALTRDSIALQQPSERSGDRLVADVDAYTNAFDELFAVTAAAHMKLFPASRVDLTYLPPLPQSPPRGYGTQRLWDCAPSVRRSAPECQQENMDFGWDTSLRYSTPGRKNHACNVTWRDPTEDMLLSLREFAFRLSVAAAITPLAELNQTGTWTVNASAYQRQHDLDWRQRVPLRGADARTVYSSSRAFLAAAVAATLAGVLAVLPLFHGWWQLGRDVSRNPLELAKAFRAPLLAGASSNAERAQLAKAVSRTRVRYGGVVVGLADDAPETAADNNSCGDGGGGGGDGEVDGEKGNTRRVLCMAVLESDRDGVQRSGIETPKEGQLFD